MAQFNYAGLAAQLGSILGTYGHKPGEAWLRRAGMDDRQITALEASFKPNQIDGVLVLREDVQFLVADGVSPIPDHELDSIVIKPTGSSDEIIYKIMSKPERMAPGGVNVFWQIHCREAS